MNERMNERNWCYESVHHPFDRNLHLFQWDQKCIEVYGGKAGKRRARVRADSVYASSELHSGIGRSLVALWWRVPEQEDLASETHLTWTKNELKSMGETAWEQDGERLWTVWNVSWNVSGLMELQVVVNAWITSFPFLGYVKLWA